MCTERERERDVDIDIDVDVQVDADINSLLLTGFSHITSSEKVQP